jgi:hypothetical protein
MALLLALVLHAALAHATAMTASSPHDQSEKASRTPAQRKISSQILYEIYKRRGEAAEKGVPPAATGTKVDERGRAFVDIRAEVTPAIERTIRALGSTIVSTSREYRSIIAWVPLLKLEQLAADPAVHAIVAPAQATTSRPQD